jgi:hypothetical protein
MSHIYTSLVTIGNVDIYNVTANPNGVLPASLGSLALRSDTAEVWQNTDGLTSWTPMLSASAPIQGMVFVDGNYTGVTENGSITCPFKTIVAALASAPMAGSILKISPKLTPYIEDVTLPDGISCEGYAGNGGYTQIQGFFVAVGPSSMSLRYLHFGRSGLGGSVTINSGCDIRDCYSSVPVISLATNPILAFHLVVNTLPGEIPLSILGNGMWEDIFSRYTSQGDVPAVAHMAGGASFSDCQMYGSRLAPGYIFDSTIGYASLFNTQVVNAGGGPAINLQNGAFANPNVVADVIAIGNIDCGVSKTIVGGLTMGGGGGLTGNPAALLFNASYAPINPLNWAGNPTDVQNAIERIATAVVALQLGAPIA